MYVAFTYIWTDPDVGYDMAVIPFIDRVKDKSDLYNPEHYYVQTAYPVKSTMDSGGILTWGSDAPVESREPRPFENMQMAVTRGAQGNVTNPDQTISIHDAIRAFTINGARLLRHDERLGSIESVKPLT